RRPIDGVVPDDDGGTCGGDVARPAPQLGVRASVGVVGGVAFDRFEATADRASVDLLDVQRGDRRTFRIGDDQPALRGGLLGRRSLDLDRYVTPFDAEQGELDGGQGGGVRGGSRRGGGDVSRHA